MSAKGGHQSAPGPGNRLGVLVEHAPDIIALIDRDGTIRYISPAVERIMGYQPTELIGRRFDEILHPNDLESAERSFATMLGTQEVVTAQHRFRRKDGSSVPLETVAQNYVDIPELEGILICSRDITRHVELERTLSKSADESADLFEDAPYGYHTVDAADVYRRVNTTELHWLQRTREDLVGRLRFADVLAPASRPTYWTAKATLERMPTVGNVDVDVDVLRKDGSTFPALLQLIAVLDDAGRFVESRATVYDISERKRAERALVKVNRALSVLSEARRQIIVARTESQLLNAACRVLVEREGYRQAAVHYVQHDAASSLMLAAKAGVGDHYLEDAAVTWADTDRGQGPMGRAVRTGRSQVNQSFLADPRMAPWRELAGRAGVESSASVPLRDASGVFATLTVFATEPDAFDVEELRLLEELAEDLSFGIGSLFADKFAGEHAMLKGGKAPPDPVARLSPREREVLKLVAEGYSSKRIATLLSVAPASVDTYRSRLMLKLNVDDVTGLVRFAIRHGVVEP